MTREELLAGLTRNIGNTVRLKLDNNTVDVIVKFVEADGVVCHPAVIVMDDSGNDFWISVDDISTYDRI